MSFEKVYIVWDYYDGPRTGLANFLGSPHAFSCEWSEVEDDYVNTYIITPVSAEILSLGLEAKAIFQEWEVAFHRGEVLHKTHPGLPGQNKRYSEIEVILNEIFKERNGAIKQIPTFRPILHQYELPKGVMRELEVEWKNI